jgi:hypothetical protein
MSPRRLRTLGLLPRGPSWITSRARTSGCAAIRARTMGTAGSSGSSQPKRISWSGWSCAKKLSRFSARLGSAPARGLSTVTGGAGTSPTGARSTSRRAARPSAIHAVVMPAEVRARRRVAGGARPDSQRALRAPPHPPGGAREPGHHEEAPSEAAGHARSNCVGARPSSFAKSSGSFVPDADKLRFIDPREGLDLRAAQVLLERSGLRDTASSRAASRR